MNSMKGINSAVSISLLLMLTALSTALAGYEIIAVQHSTQKAIKNIASTEAKKAQSSLYTCINIESIHESTIYLRNCGNSIINTSKLTVYIDGIPQKIDTNYSTKLIYPSKLGKIYIKNHFIGNHEVKIDYMHYAQDSITHNFGYAYLVEGNSYMKTSGDLNITPNQSFTFMAWVYFKDIPLFTFNNVWTGFSAWSNCWEPAGWGNRMIMFYKSNNDMVHYFWIVHDTFGEIFVFTMPIIGNSHMFLNLRQYPSSFSILLDDLWYHITEVWNTSNKEWVVYLNGKEIFHKKINHHLYLYAIQFSSCGTVDIHAFDDIRIYKTALNQTQIIKCMYGDNCPTKGLIAYYNFNNCELKNMANPSKFWLTGKNIMCISTTE